MASGSRMHWMDALRGLAVILVVLMHSTSYPAQQGQDLNFAAANASANVLAPYRMPLLLMLSGMLLGPSVKRNLGRYYWGKVRRIVWPLLVWGIITAFAEEKAGRLGALNYWLSGPLHLWFLGVLIVYYAVGPVLRFIPAIGIVVGLYLTMALFPIDNFLLRRLMFYGVFFFLGAALWPHVDLILKRGVWFPIVMGAMGILVAAGSAFQVLRVHPDSHVGWMVAPLPGMAAILWAGPRLPRIPWLEFAGRRSLVLYATHMPIMVWFTLTYSWLAEDVTPFAFYGPQILLGLGIPVLLAIFYRRVRYLYELPASFRRREPQTAARP